MMSCSTYKPFFERVMGVMGNWFLVGLRLNQERASDSSVGRGDFARVFPVPQLQLSSQEKAGGGVYPLMESALLLAL